MPVLALCLLSLTTGCASFGELVPSWMKSQPKTEIPKDNLVLTGHSTLRELIPPQLRQELDAAKYVFDSKKYAEAQVMYHKLAYLQRTSWVPNIFGSEAPPDATTNDPDRDQKDKEKKRVPKAVREEALFYEAECQRIQKNYRDASDTYTKLLMDHTRTQYTKAACTGLFEIADAWLEPTRQQMDQYQEQLQGKRWFVSPASYVHFTHEMPMLDAEGNALAILNTIRLHDIRGDMGKKALLYLGTINFFRRDYKEADFYFTQLKDEYPNSEYAAKAIKQSVICKQLCTGGSVYDCRPVEESKKLLMTAQGAYPELAKEEKWIENQLTSINIQQADRDWNIAEFYRRTSHPGAAYFYYEIVRRRYPRTSYAAQAGQKMTEIRAKVEREQGRAGAPPPAKEQDPPLQPLPFVAPQPQSLLPPQPPQPLPPQPLPPLPPDSSSGPRR